MSEFHVISFDGIPQMRVVSRVGPRVRFDLRFRINRWPLPSLFQDLLWASAPEGVQTSWSENHGWPLLVVSVDAELPSAEERIAVAAEWILGTEEQPPAMERALERYHETAAIASRARDAIRSMQGLETLASPAKRNDAPAESLRDAPGAPQRVGLRS